jgi:hypothetical protein
MVLGTSTSGATMFLVRPGGEGAFDAAVRQLTAAHA